MSRTLTVVSIVDDDPSVRRALQRVVKSAGYIVETFASAREFLDSSPQGRSACLILDIHLDGGGLNGFELQERLAAERSTIPVIFITAHDNPPTRERVRRSGVVAYLPKPLDDLTLLDTIRTAVGQV
jgi:FixJ family two-component response regulator